MQALNERAVAVMSRMSDKLTGRDFPAELRNGHDSDSINVQVLHPSRLLAPVHPAGALHNSVLPDIWLVTNMSCRDCVERCSPVSKVDNSIKSWSRSDCPLGCTGESAHRERHNVVQPQRFIHR